MKIEVYTGDVALSKVMITLTKFKDEVNGELKNRYELQVYIDEKRCVSWYEVVNYGSYMKSYEIIADMLYDANSDVVLKLNEEPYSVSNSTIEAWLNQNKYAEFILDFFGWRYHCIDGDLFNELMNCQTIEI